MKFYSILLISLVGYSIGTQIKTIDDDDMTKNWIATIDDNYDCMDMTAIILNMYNGYSHGRKLYDHTAIQEMDSELDCFVKFEGDDEFAALINRTEGVIDVDSNDVVTFFETWGRDRIDQPDLPLSKTKFTTGFTGVNVNIYILDTGIYKVHNEFKNRSHYGENYVNVKVPEDDNGHGTHVSSLAAGTNYGIAYGANIIGVKVLDSSGSGSTAGVIQGIQWAANHVKQASVLSLSLGGGKNTAMEKAVKDAAKTNIVTVAAGNANDDACRYSPSGAGGNGINRDVISVGSSTVSDWRSSFSNYGKCVDIYSPGSAIVGAGITGPQSSVQMSGTSMATPFVAGVAATLLDKHNFDKDAAIDNLFAIALYGKISDVRYDPSNLFLQVETKTGPPTPPTISPTFPPTFSDPQLCINKVGCYDYAESSFNPVIRGNDPIIGSIVVPKSGDELMCKTINYDLSGKIVVVTRGECLFFDKVKFAQNAGAVAVVIALDTNEDIFEPGYYGDGNVNIKSCMVSMNTGNKMRDNIGKYIVWGIQELFTDPTTLEPTNKPTNKPTTAEPTRKPTTASPTKTPSKSPSKSPVTNEPTLSPTTASPTKSPSKNPSKSPTMSPSKFPSKSPTTASPTKSPSKTPSKSPTMSPSKFPTKSPTTESPTKAPSKTPTRNPTTFPSPSPTSKAPTSSPTTFESIFDSEQAFCQTRTKTQCINNKRCFWRRLDGIYAKDCYTKLYKETERPSRSPTQAPSSAVQKPNKYKTPDH